MMSLMYNVHRLVLVVFLFDLDSRMKHNQIDDAAATEARVRELGMKYYPGKEEVEKEIALDIKAVQLYEITIEHLTGKQIQEK